ncbi:MAG: lysophospholipid acyltransferase family protein [Salinisphaera sp.]|jgi:lysophospholipid acyltransferase (LPLAT)-like uncharacterized protein|nr:lysophospholipid acyltransferase family protein [Salinisphaera sp.]
MTKNTVPDAALPWHTRLWMTIAAPLIRIIARALLASYRIERVDGEHHLNALLAENRAAILCCWHQRLSVCAGYLLQARSRGLRPGFLVSPSKDGELVARVVSGMGATIMRGSATRTGAKALREMYAGIRAGTSPIVHPDGPHGPPNQAKPGTALIAQMTRTRLLPMSFSANRYWQLGSWDRLIIPKPFAHVIVTVGEPITVARGDGIEASTARLTEILDSLDAAADDVMPSRPQRKRER